MKKHIAVIVLLTIFVFCGLVIAEGVPCRYAQVITKKGPLNMRNGSSKKASIIKKIPRNTIIPVTSVDDAWCLCAYNGKEGYVMTKYLSFVDISQFRTLSQYDSGSDVLALKERLRALHYLDANAKQDDHFDVNTKLSIQRFQSAHGLEETGIVSPELQALILWGSAGDKEIQSSASENVAKQEPATKPAASKTMKVSISCNCSGYNHVGNEWSKYFSVNGSAVSSGNTVTITPGKSMSIYTKITERDKVPDVGSAKDSIKITEDDLKTGFSVTQKLSVRENRGRYSGNRAYWTIVYTFSPK